MSRLGGTGKFVSTSRRRATVTPAEECSYLKGGITQSEKWVPPKDFVKFPTLEYIGDIYCKCSLLEDSDRVCK